MRAWVQIIPETWRSARLGLLADIYAGGTPDRGNITYWTNGTNPWINSGAVNQWTITKPSELITDRAISESSTQWVTKGALIMALAGQGKTKGMVARMGISATCNQSMAAIVPNENVEPRFLHFWLHSKYQDIRNMAGGDKRDGLNLVHVGNIHVPLPDLSTQRRIADYLDRETVQIDAMAEALDGLVSRLEERRSSLSRQHIETAREHYSFTQVKFVADITTGTGDTQDATETGYPFYVRSNTPVFSSDWEFEGDAVLTAGDGAGVGRVYHLATGRFRAHQRVYVIHNFRAITPEYFLHVFRALFPDSVLSGSAQTTVPSVRLHMISDLKIPLPPLDEQRRIADHLDAETAKIDAMIAKAGELRALLDERRSALITATVTGQHPVPEEH